MATISESNARTELKRKMRASLRLVKRLKDVKHSSSTYSLANGGLGIAREPSPEYVGGSLPVLHAGKRGLNSCRKREGGRENSFQVLEDIDPDSSCTRQASLRGKARIAVSFLSEELCIKPVGEPGLLRCGELRRVVRQCFPDCLPAISELSIKTVAKLEHSCCKSCAPRFESLKDKWREERFRPVVTDVDHLNSFKKALIANIPRGWNTQRSPYIPDGHATLTNTRKNGGNWNEEEFSEECRVELVFSSGKPRVVTCYSAYNTRILSPLHQSLYSTLKRKGWLLVGDPTDERVGQLNGGGDYLSFDYVGATDNIKLSYVKAAIDALLEQGEGITEDQSKCLRVLSGWKLGGREVTCGQPMGSLISFPLLCLINKTVVDMSLSSLLTQGKITFKEWTCHRCMINGDDLLIKDPRSKVSIKGEIVRHASAVGMKVNEEKTMESSSEAEINSTLFVEGHKQKKANAGSLYMRPEVNDVLGFALSSTRTVDGFVKVVRRNEHILSKQEDSGLSRLPWRYIVACRKDYKIRRAICSAPTSKRTPPANLFPISDRPIGYDLSIEEEIALIDDRVKFVRDRALRARQIKERIEFKRSMRSWRSQLKKKPPCEDDKVLLVLAHGWERKKKEQLVEADGGVTTGPLYQRVSDNSVVFDMIGSIRGWRAQRREDPVRSLVTSVSDGCFLAFS